MAPQAFDALIRAAFHAGVSPDRVTQTIGNAPASKGTHARDGFVLDGAKPVPYCAAVDLSVHNLTRDSIKVLLHHLAVQGFAAWYRYQGSFAGHQHVHAVFVGLKMKPMLQAQVRDFLHDRTGLAGHEVEMFWTADAALDYPLRLAFLRANPQ
jgi:hypothetical protein